MTIGWHFDNTYSSLVTAGDSSGNLDTIFNKLADYLEERKTMMEDWSNYLNDLLA